MNYFIICDTRENFPSYMSGKKVYNDHISQSSLDEIIKAIKKCGYNVEYFGGVNDLIDYYHDKIKMPEGYYINLNDGLNEKHKRGQTPLLLELLKVPFSGPDVFHILLANDKYFCSLCLNKSGIMTPNAVQILDVKSIDSIKNISFPVIIKPNCEGSSIGINSNSFCNNYDAAAKHCKELLENYDELIVEEYIPGYEVTNLVIRNQKGLILLNEPMVISLNNQLYLNQELFGIEEKCYGFRKYWLAEQILSADTVNKIKLVSEKIADILNLSSFFRFDYRIYDNEVYFIEANTNPAFGLSSDVGKLCELRGISFEEFVSVYMDSLID